MAKIELTKEQEIERDMRVAASMDTRNAIFRLLQGDLLMVDLDVELARQQDTIGRQILWNAQNDLDDDRGEVLDQIECDEHARNMGIG